MPHEQSPVPSDVPADSQGSLAVSQDEHTSIQETTFEHLRTDEEAVNDEIASLEESFAGLSDDYYLLDKVGEGTFSSVYIAVDLKHKTYDNSKWHPSRFVRPRGQQPYIVAVKRIYVTASPDRIHNELKMLKEISGCKQTVPLVSALRHKDQVLVVMPYVEHTDFRLFYKRLTMLGVKKYMGELLQGLAFLHDKGIIHRDIKPTNFLYNVKTGTGVIVDLGLAEKEPENNNECVCMRSPNIPRYAVRPEGGYKKDDPRPSRRANRAGTRGFRAPEVLFKCLSQTRKIDIWSAGVILLEFFTRRFTFFSSADDSEAVIELATLFGKRIMERCANLHGSVLETNIPTITDDGYTFEQVILWCNHKTEDTFTRPQQLGIDLLRLLLEPNVRKRPSALELLEHPFFTEEFDIDYDIEPKRESRKREAHEAERPSKRSKRDAEQEHVEQVEEQVEQVGEQVEQLVERVEQDQEQADDEQEHDPAAAHNDNELEHEENPERQPTDIGAIKEFQRDMMANAGDNDNEAEVVAETEGPPPSPTPLADPAN